MYLTGFGETIFSTLLLNFDKNTFKLFSNQLKKYQILFPMFEPKFCNAASQVPEPFGVQSLLCNPPLIAGATTDGIYDVSINGKSENGYCQFTNDGNAWLVRCGVCVVISCILITFICTELKYVNRTTTLCEHQTSDMSKKSFAS